MKRLQETVDVRQRLSSALEALSRAVDEFAEVVGDANAEEWSEKESSLVVDLYLIVFNAEWRVRKRLAAFERKRKT
jgi:hypothetical protein